MRALILSFVLVGASAFSVGSGTARRTVVGELLAHPEDTPDIDRRKWLQTTGAAVITSVGICTHDENSFLAQPESAWAVEPKKVVVVGASGQSGRRVLERLASKPGLDVVAGVRNVEKAKESLSKSSTVIRGAMVQQVPSVEASAVQFAAIDVAKDTVEEMTQTLQGADTLVMAIGFSASNPLKMNQVSHEVENVGASKLVDAAKAAGVKKVVMISCILTNARAWGQEKSPAFVFTNAIGNALDEKLVAEKHLRASGLDYTIVRPGGLTAKPPTGALVISGEDTINAGEVSRDLVADVCVASIYDPKASNKVLEIIEDDEKPPEPFTELAI